MRLFWFLTKKRRRLLLLLFAAAPCMLFLSGNLVLAASDEALAGVIACVEIYSCFLCSLSCCLILQSKDERELIVLSGTNIVGIAVFEAGTAFAVSYGGGMLWGLLLLPAWIKIRFLLSYTVTALFLFSLSFLIRCLVGNVYGAVGVHAALFLIFYQNSGLAPEAVITQEICARDPFVGGYMHQTLYGDNGYWYISDGIWAQNRTAFFLLALLLFALGLFFAKRTLHHNTKRG